MVGALTDKDRWARMFPRGPRDFGIQVSIWLGFLLLYQVARGVADRGAEEAFANGRALIDAERAVTGLVEVDIQRVVIGAGDGLVQALNWTYWNSQFTVVGLALLWVYFARNDSFLRLRNTLLLANVLGLIGFHGDADRPRHASSPTRDSSTRSRRRPG